MYKYSGGYAPRDDVLSAVLRMGGQVGLMFVYASLSFSLFVCMYVCILSKSGGYAPRDNMLSAVYTYMYMYTYT